MGRATTTFITPIIHAEDPSLVLDLQFQRDGAYSARRGPLPTFTRASAAWRVNSAGVIVPAAVNEARIDYNPTTLEARGLLIEEQRTNLSTHSNDLTNAAWGKVNTTAAADQGISPDGTVNAGLFAETTAYNNIHYVTTSITAITAGTAYTTSVFLKKGTGATAPDWVVLSFLAGAFGSKSIAFNVSTGATGATAGGQTAVVTQMPNGWWRIAMTATALASVSTGGLYLAFTNNTNSASTPTYVGQTTSNVFVWGAQFEAGAFATSYIPTTTAAVIRSADLCSITGGAFSGFWNASEGTLVFKGSKPAIQAYGTTYVAVDDNTSNNRLILFYSTNEFFDVVAGGVSQAAISSGVSVSENTRFGMAARYKANDFALSVSGGAIGTDVSGTIPSVSQMSIGSRLSTPMSLWVESLQYFNPETQFQALSTP